MRRKNLFVLGCSLEFNQARINAGQRRKSIRDANIARSSFWIVEKSITIRFRSN